MATCTAIHLTLSALNGLETKKQNKMKFNQERLDQFKRGGLIVKNNFEDETVISQFIIEAGVFQRAVFVRETKNMYFSVGGNGKVILDYRRPAFHLFTNLSDCIEQAEAKEVPPCSGHAKASDDEIEKELRDKIYDQKKCAEISSQALSAFTSTFGRIDFGTNNPSTWAVYYPSPDFNKLTENEIKKTQDTLKELDKISKTFEKDVAKNRKKLNKKRQEKADKQHEKAKDAYYITGHDMEYFDETSGDWIKCSSRRMYRFIKR